MAAPATVQSIIGYYVNLLIIQYHNQPKAQAVITSLISSLIQNGILLDIQNGYNIDTAIGHQLDILGKYADIDRFYQGQTFTGFFAFTTYTEISPPASKRGFSTYASYLPAAGQWLTYAGILSQDNALSDSDFRILLKLRIIQNNMNFSRQAIDQNIFNVFGDNLVPDSLGNMVMDYISNSQNSAIFLAAYQKGVLPKPMGVKLRYIINHTLPFFGFATYAGYSPLETGFATYATYANDSGETLDYAKLIGS